MNKALLILEPVDLIASLSLGTHIKTYDDTLNKYYCANPAQVPKTLKTRTQVVKNLALPPLILEIFEDPIKRIHLASRMHLATQLMVETRQKHGRIIIERYHIILKLLNEYSMNFYAFSNSNNTTNSNNNSRSNNIRNNNNNRESITAITTEEEQLIKSELLKKSDIISYELARYMDALYQEFVDKKISGGANTNSNSNNNSNNGSSANSNNNGSSNANSSANNNGVSNYLIAYTDESAAYYIVNAIYYYMRSLKGNNKSLIRKALPRMLTLWFSYTSFRDDSNNNTNNENQRRSNNSTNTNTNTNTALSQKLLLYQKDVNSSVEKYGVGANKRVQPHAWFHCLPQLVSRLGHHDKYTVTIISNIIKDTLVTYPRHSIWHIACLLKSENNKLVQLGKKFVSESCEILKNQNREQESDMLKDSLILLEKMSNLAKLTVPERDKKIRFEWTKGSNGQTNENCDLTQFLVPNQHTLLNPPFDLLCGTNQNNNSNNSNNHLLKSISDTSLYIQRFHETVEVATSKARPKIIKLTTTSGKQVKFLLKQEKNGDLRKDARMMEFNATVNRILLEDSESRKRNLRLKTYAVVCLSEETGLLEWVDNTSCLRQLIITAYSFYQKTKEYELLPAKEIMKPFQELQIKYETDLDLLVQEYHTLILNKSKPCFHKWFLENFHNPTDWLDARNRFTRSAAVWSTVGYVIGLGDRHTENILLDTTSGECVHVDFDCLFDKGLTLQRPEIVPFRLTPNMVDAMVRSIVILFIYYYSKTFLDYIIYILYMECIYILIPYVIIKVLW